MSSSALQNLHFGLLQALHPRPPCGSCAVQHLESYVPHPSQWLGSTVVLTSLVEVVLVVDVADVVSDVVADFDDVEVEDEDVDDTEDVDEATEVVDDVVDIAGFIDVVEGVDDVEVVEDGEVDVIASVVVACVGMVEHFIQ